MAGLRRFVAGQLPTYAAPLWWAVVAGSPVTAIGKADVAALRELATATAQDRGKADRMGSYVMVRGVRNALRGAG
jgi:membrane protein required for beta-lactamase induction